MPLFDITSSGVQSIRVGSAAARASHTSPPAALNIRTMLTASRWPYPTAWKSSRSWSSSASCSRCDRARGHSVRNSAAHSRNRSASNRRVVVIAVTPKRLQLILGMIRPPGRTGSGLPCRRRAAAHTGGRR